jgi:hypothetical protein
VGLVSRKIEAAGIATVTLDMIWVYQNLVGMPRVAAIEHPFGRPFGDVGDAARQREVLLAGLRVAETAKEAGHPSAGTRTRRRRSGTRPSRLRSSPSSSSDANRSPDAGGRYASMGPRPSH